MAIINRNTDYALRALGRLAGREAFTPVSALAEAEHVPVDFLRKIMQVLHRAGFVESQEGPAGGYRLAQPPEAISVQAVVEAVQGRPVVNQCFEATGRCEFAPACPLRTRLSEVQEKLDEWLSEINVADLLAPAAAGEGARS